jgi:hypothetical protein
VITLSRNYCEENKKDKMMIMCFTYKTSQTGRVISLECTPQNKTICIFLKYLLAKPATKL